MLPNQGNINIIIHFCLFSSKKKISYYFTLLIKYKNSNQLTVLTLPQ